MNPIYQSLFITYAKNRAKKNGQVFRRAGKQDYKSFKIHARTQFSDGFLIVVGMLSAGLGLKSFLLPNGFIDGGVMGISLLVSEVTGFSLAWLIVVINLPFIYMGYKQIHKFFALKTLTAIIGLALCLVFIPYPILTTDKLLVSVFGGFFLGVGIGLAMRGGSVIDGTEILALSITRKSVLSIGDVILIINIVIFCVAAFVLSIEQALYSILTYISASRTVDYLISGIEEYTGVTIISEKSEAIRKMITEQLGRGVNIYRGTNPNDLQLLTSRPGNTISYTDVNPPRGLLYYQTEIVAPNVCEIKRSGDFVVSSRSNIHFASATATDDLLKFKWDVTPTNQNHVYRITIDESILGTNYMMIDGIGRTLLKDKLDSKEVLLNLEQFSAGVYYVVVGASVKKIIRL